MWTHTGLPVPLGVWLPGRQGIMGGVSDLIVVSGPPGAGKTTVARALSQLFDPSALVPGDQFFAFIDQGYIAPWTSAAHRQNEVVTEAAGAAAGRLAAGGFTVVYDGVIGPWFLETFRDATGAPFLRYAILLPPERICLERVRSRADHGFTDQQAALHMHQQFADADIDPRYVIASTDEAATLACRLFHLVQQGRLRWPA
jgi:cytidylate kinase